MSNACDTIWNTNSCQRVTIRKRIFTNASDAAVRWDHAILTARDQRFALSFNQAIPRTVIDGIPARNCNSRKAIAAREHPISNAINAVRNCDTCKATAIS